MTFWYFISPFFTFLLMTLNLAVRGNVYLEDQEFEISEGNKVDIGISTIVYGYQILILFTIVVLLDRYYQDGYKRQGGTEGQLPPQLEVH